MEEGRTELRRNEDTGILEVWRDGEKVGEIRAMEDDIRAMEDDIRK